MRYLPLCDLVVVFENGRVTEIGHFEQLIANDGDFAKFFAKYLIEATKEEKNQVEEELRDTIGDQNLLATIEKQ